MLMDGNDVPYEAGKAPMRNGECTKTKSFKEGKSRPTRVPFRLLFGKQTATTLLFSLHATPYHSHTVILTTHALEPYVYFLVAQFLATIDPPSAFTSNALRQSVSGAPHVHVSPYATRKHVS